MDPLRTDPDKYKLVLENERVRVLEYRDKPGDKTKQHSHPDFVLYTLSTFKRRLTLGDGRTLEAHCHAGTDELFRGARPRRRKWGRYRHTRADDRAQGAAPKQER
jgi:hypothetical protein